MQNEWRGEYCSRWCGDKAGLAPVSITVNKMKLVGRGADQTITHDDGDTPREIAVKQGHAECAALLR